MSIKLRFVRGDGPLTGIISRAELGFPYTHVEAISDDDTILTALIGDGVVERYRDYDWGQNDLEMIVDVPATGQQSEDFHKFLRAQLGKPYDLDAFACLNRGVLIAHEDIENQLERPAFICSALQTAALLSAGVIQSAPGGVRLTTPRDLLYAVGALTAIPEPTRLKP